MSLPGLKLIFDVFTAKYQIPSLPLGILGRLSTFEDGSNSIAALLFHSLPTQSHMLHPRF